MAALSLALSLLGMASMAANDRPLIYGMNPMPGEWAKHASDYATWEPQQYDKMRNAGCAAVRVGVGWDLVEPNPGDRNWSDIDNDIRLMLDRGFEPVLLVVATPTWALLPGQGTPFYPPQPQYRAQFEKFVFDVARKFRGRVRYYEFWNEPNGYGWHTDQGYQKAEEYVPWLIHGCNAVKRGDPNALWSIGGLDDNGTGYADDYLRKCYYYMSAGYFDAVCEHPYSSSTADLWKLDDLRGVMASYGQALPIWITEMGWPADGRESTVASWITDYLTRLSGDAYDFCKIATYHTSVDFTAEPVGYGLMRYDLSTKAGYTAFQSRPKPSRAVVSGTPSVVSQGPAKVRIDFTSDRSATAQIMYGTTNAYGMVTQREATPTTMHSISIDGLLPNTVYHYRIRLGAGEYADNFSSDYAFTTVAGNVVGLVGEVSVTDVTTNSATISWTTTVPSAGAVRYGSGYDYTSLASGATLTTNHSITLTGLAPDTTYQCRILSVASGYGNLNREIDPVTTDKTPALLGNGGFESFGPKQPWIIYGRSDGRVTGTWYWGFAARSGGAFFGSAASWDHKTGGCYQEVGAVPGHEYQVTAYTRCYQSAGAPGDDAARLGIDPTGGTDPASTNIVWGSWAYSDDWTPMSVSATAAADKMTIYVDIRQPFGYEWNINVVDDVALADVTFVDMPLSEVKTAPVGTAVSATGVVCTANFGDHIYVQEPDGFCAMRVNGLSGASVGDLVRFRGAVAFTGPQKSVDSTDIQVESTGSDPMPAGMLIRSVGGAPIPGQTALLVDGQGIYTLNQLVKICGRVVGPETGQNGFFYVDDGSRRTTEPTDGKIKVILPSPMTVAAGTTVAVEGIAEAEQAGGQWTPVIRMRASDDVREYD